MTTITTSAPLARRGDADPSVAVWLFVMAGLVALMVLVGGATRLTDSGLSITEWRPVSGAPPPLSDAAWAAEFEKYKKIPEYQTVNAGMSMAAFKTIYWWEWGHRFLGRVIGAAFLAPFIVFAAKGRITGALRWRLAGLFALGGFQGFLGWWMVSSGLTERVDVSQYRLAAHLSLATILFGALLWTALDVWRAARPALAKADAQPAAELAPWAAALAAAILAQIALGAFVAGLRAGAHFNTWPLMDGALLPKGYFIGAPRLLDLFETPAAVQFNHRLMAYALVAAALAFAFRARKTVLAGWGQALAGLAAAQTLIGVLTVVNAAPISLGLAHQSLAVALFAAAVGAAHTAFSARAAFKAR